MGGNYLHTDCIDDGQTLTMWPVEEYESQRLGEHAALVEADRVEWLQKLAASAGERLRYERPLTIRPVRQASSAPVRTARAALRHVRRAVE